MSHHIPMAIRIAAALAALVALALHLFPPDVSSSVDAKAASHWGGNAFAVMVPAPLPGPFARLLGTIADSNERPNASRLVLLEQGARIGKPHSIHAEISAAGQGRYSHWNDTLVFSASDNSDPRTNGRAYAVAYPVSLPGWPALVLLLVAAASVKRKPRAATTTVASDHLQRPAYRPDVDGLRGVAVLSVVGFHAFPDAVPGGFVGVDVFFVISGYLITSIIVGSLERGAFSFREFYERRIRRIFPALVVVLATSLALGWYLLLAEEYKQLGRHVAGGAGFAANLLLWQDSGYFDATAEARPLLHLWSLGVEEQFYIAWPILLALAWKRRISLVLVTVAIGLASFCLNVATVAADPVGAFYSPLSRIWELLIGAGLACAAARHRPPRAVPVPAAGREIAAAAGLVLIVAALALVNKDRSFPGWWALMPSIGAALLIAAGPVTRVNRAILAHPWLVWVGLVSYPLYLWHWPLLSFAGMSVLPAHLHQANAAVVALSIALAWITYRFLERPVRFGSRGKAAVVLLCALLATVGIAGYVAWREDGWSGRFNTAMSERDLEQQRARYWNKSRSRPFAPGFTNVVVYGDSQAQDVAEALANDPGLRVASIGSNYTCTAFSQTKKGLERTAAQCRQEFESLLASEALKAAEVFIYAHGWTDDPAERDAYAEGLRRIRAVNPRLRVWFFGYKPFLGNSWVSINAITRHHRGRARMNEFLDSVKVLNEAQDRAARALAAELGAGWIDVARIFCDGGCPFYEDGKFSYFDQNHWTEAGAERFFRRLARTPEYRELAARPR